MCPAIIKNYKSELMLLHQEKSWKRIVNEFWITWNFHNCLGTSMANMCFLIIKNLFHSTASIGRGAVHLYHG
jgi:hypothetical protein